MKGEQWINLNKPIEHFKKDGVHKGRRKWAAMGGINEDRNINITPWEDRKILDIQICVE